VKVVRQAVDETLTEHQRRLFVAVVSSWAALERFLRTDPADVGCVQAMEILHVYVDLVAADPDAARRYPGGGRAPWPRAARAARTSAACSPRSPKTAKTR
jgi:hypothetical protein